MSDFNKLKTNRLIKFVLVMLCLVIPTFAQTESARIQGTIGDQSNAAVAGATIKVVEKATNRELQVQTAEDGSYTVASLSPGVYQIEVTQANFKTTKQEVTLEVQQVAVLNFNLEPGGVSEVVTITTDVPQVESATSSIGEVIQGKQIVELPLNGRNVLELARLTPGVTTGIPDGIASGVGGNAETYRGGNTGGAAISVNGQRTQANNFLLDGVDNNESLVNTINIFPAAEAVQEFRVQTSVATAEFGRGGGGIINSVIKSGRNDFYGSAFGFFRNDNLDARPTFNSVKSEFRRGQFGGTFGGPLYLPGFNEGGPFTSGGRDKLFFFADYEGLRQFLPFGEETATVPTAAFRNGDFSALLGNSGINNNGQLLDPLTGLPIPGNRLDLLPGNRLNQAALNYLRAFPLPNAPGVLNNYRTVRNQTLQSDTVDVRIDGNINDKNQAFGRFSYGKYDQTTSSRLPNLPAGFGSGTNPIRNRAGVLGLSSSLSDKLFNEFRISAARISYGFTPPFFDTPISANLGIVNANRDASLGGGALIGGFNGQLEYTGDFGPYLVPQNTYQIVDGLSYTTGKHNFKFGGTILRREVGLFRPNRGKGFFFLVGNGNADGFVQTGFEQSDLLIGFVRNYQIGPPFGSVGTRNWENAAFAQDDWRVTPRLTLNLGLRYEYFTNPTEQYGRQANFDVVSGRLVVAGGSDDALVNTDKNNFSPRVGFAYDLTGKGRSVLRGGYGLFYFLDRGGIDNQLAQNPPYSGFSQFNYEDGVRINLSGRAPNGSNDSRLATSPLPIGSVNDVNLNDPRNVNVLAVLPDNKISNVQQFNVQFQQQLTDNTAVSVAYVGARGRNLTLYYNLNGRVVEPGTNIPCPRALVSSSCYPTFGGNRVNVRDDNGKSSYDGLQIQLDRRFSDGWQYIASYAYSKTKDNGEGAFNAVADLNLNFVEPFATSSADFPHVFSFASVYDVPFGRGRRFGSDIPKALDLLIGGLQLNGIYRFTSGQAFDVRRNGIRVDLIGDPYTGTTTGRYLNFSAFREAPAGRFGTLERNSLRSPYLSNLNLGLTKNFNFTERTKIQFRVEAFNITNSRQLGVPNTDIGNFNPAVPDNLSRFDFGTISSTRGFSNRQIQLGVRLEF